MEGERMNVIYESITDLMKTVEKLEDAQLRHLMFCIELEIHWRKEE